MWRRSSTSPGRKRLVSRLGVVNTGLLATIVGLLVMAPNVGGVHASPVGPAHTRPSSQYGGGPYDWPTYLHDRERTGYSGLTVTPNVHNVSNLSLVWSHGLPNATDGSVIVVNGTVIAGSEGGFLYALNASTGHSVPGWTVPFLGSSTNYSECKNNGNRISLNHGITSTATSWGGNYWENGGNNTFYEIGPTGSILHRVDVGNNSTTMKWYYDYLWSSPLIHSNHAFVGTAALCEYEGYPNTSQYTSDFRYIQGQLLKINLTRDVVTYHFNVTKGTSPADTGGSIWSSPMYDQDTDTVWVTTGNANQTYQTPANGEYPQSIVALHANNLGLRGGCQVVSAASATYGADYDFGATPTLFNDSRGHSYVGAVNKNGVFYAVSATNFTGASTGCNGGSLVLAWTKTLAGTAGDGTVSPAAFDGSRLYVASGGAGGGAGYVQALDPATGNDVWTTNFKMSAPFACNAYGAVTVAGGVVYIDAVGQGSHSGNGVLYALSASTGASLMTPIVFNQTIAGPPVVAEGMVFVETGSLSFTGVGYVDALVP